MRNIALCAAVLIAIVSRPAIAQDAYQTFQQHVLARWNPPPGTPKLTGEVVINGSGAILVVRFANADPATAAARNTLSAAILQTAPLTAFSGEAAQALDGIVRLGFEFDPAQVKKPGVQASTVANPDRTADSLYYVANTRPPDAFLGLRDQPSLKAGKRIASMPNGTALRVLHKDAEGWWNVQVVSTGQIGWALSGLGGKLWIEKKPVGDLAASSSSSSGPPVRSGHFPGVTVSHSQCGEDYASIVIDAKSVEDGWVSTRESLDKFGAFAVDLLYGKCNGSPNHKLRVLIRGPHAGCNGICDLLSLENRAAVMNSYGGNPPAGFIYTFRGQQWYATDQDNAYWKWEQGRIAKQQQANQQRLQEERARQLRAAAGGKQDINGFMTGGTIDSINQAAQRCSQLVTNPNNVRYRCPSGEVTVFLTEHLKPQLVAIVRLNFCDPKDGPAVAAQVAQQFGVLEFPWVTRTSGQSAVGALGSGSYLEIFPSGQLTIPVPGASTGCPNNFFPYSIQVVNGGVLQRDKQDQMEKERILKSTPTMKF